MAEGAENRQGPNRGDKEFVRRKKHYYHNGNNNRNNQYNNRNGYNNQGQSPNQNNNRFSYKRNEKPVETAEDIANDTKRLEKEIMLEINEIKAIDITC